MTHFKAWAKTPADKIRFGKNLHRGNPDRIRPYLLLAEHALAALVSNVHLAQAVNVDHRVWALQLKGNQTIVWWADKETQPFIIAVGLYGMEMAHKGTAWMATKCLNFLLGLALADKISAVDLFAEAGLIHSGAEPSTPGGMT